MSNNSLASLLQTISGQKALFENLGEFICHYASIEKHCHLIFDNLSGLPRDVARSIMGGSQLSNLLPVLTRIIDLGDMDDDQKAEYHKCIDHLNAITTLRHTLIHRGAEVTTTGIVSSNELLARSKESIEILSLHADDIKAAADDCRNISLRLILLIAPSVRVDLDAESEKAIFRPWRYKPVQPDRPHQPPRSTRRSKPRQRPSSQK